MYILTFLYVGNSHNHLNEKQEKICICIIYINYAEFKEVLFSFNSFINM